MREAEQIMESLKRAEESRDKYPYRSENWDFFDRDVQRLRERLSECEPDDRYRLRTF